MAYDLTISVADGRTAKVDRTSDTGAGKTRCVVVFNSNEKLVQISKRKAKIKSRDEYLWFHLEF
jgi:hypothetical protein